MAKITIYLNDELFKKMKSLGLPMSYLIQMMANYYFENKYKQNTNEKGGKQDVGKT